jgi:hypothetical protein
MKSLKLTYNKKQHNLFFFYSTFSKKAETRPQAVGFSQMYSAAIFSNTTAEISAYYYQKPLRTAA